MTTRAKGVIISILVITCVIFGITNYFKERFEDLDYCNTIKTTADWNTVGQYGAPGKNPAEEVANVTAAAGEPVDVATNGKYVFVVSTGASGGFTIQNAITHTREVTHVSADNDQGVAIHGRYAYTVDDVGEITKYDCGDVSSATNVSNTDLAGTDLRGIAVSNGWLYIASDAGLIAKDDYDGAYFTVATGGDPQDVAIYGPYILVADGDGGLKIYEHLNTAAAPNSVGSIALADCRGVSVYGTYAILGAGDSVFIVDVSNPSTPSVSNRLGSAGDCNEACVLAGKVYAACGDAGTMVYVGDDLTNLRSIGISPNPALGSAMAIVPVGHEVAVAQNGSGTVQYLSQGNSISPPAGWTSTEATAHRNPIAATIYGDYLYVSEQTYGLITYDLNTMTIVDSIQVPDGTSATGLCCTGSFLLQGLGVGGLRCYNLNDPSNPTVEWTISSIGGGATVMSVDANGAYAFVSASGFGTTGIYKIPILGGSPPAPTTSVAIADNVYNIDVSGEIVYAAATGQGLIAYDLDLTEIDSYYYATGDCEDVICENDYAYLNYGEGGLLVVYIGDVGSGISLADNLDYATIGNILSIARFDKYLCVGEEATSSELQFVDVSDPTAIGAPSTSLEGVVVPAGLELPVYMAKWNTNLVVVDYLGGVYTWETYPDDCTDQLTTYSVLHSNKMNDLTGIRFTNWRSWEFYPDDDKDTCYYYMFYYKDATALWDTLRVIPVGAPTPGYDEYQVPNPPPWASEGWFWIESFFGTGFDSLWWYIEITDWHNVWADPDSAGPGGPYTGVWKIDSLMIGYGNGMWPGTRGSAMTLHFDFGGGEDQNLIIGKDSSATDRYDPGLDVPFVPPADRPYAYWALDDPFGPEGVGLSACYAPTLVGARPVRLILSDPATVTWTIPPDIIQGEFVLNEIDLATTSSMDLEAGEYVMLPGGGFAIFFFNQLEHGWNLTGTSALPISAYPSQTFNAMSTNVWCYDDAVGGYYNPEKIEQGKAYFVFVDQDKTGQFCGVMNDWVRTEIHPGWNLISGPAAGSVHLSNILTRPDSALWAGPIYKLTDSGYEATEWINPGEGYWAYGLDNAELFIDTLLSGSRKLAPTITPGLTSELTLSIAGNETRLTIGVDSRASMDIDNRFDRLQPPARPGNANLGYLYCQGAPAPLSTDINREGEWELHIRNICTASSDFPLTATKDGEAHEIGASGVRLEPGVYKIAYSERRLPEMITLGVRPNPFNATAFINVEIPFDGDVELSAYDITGRKVKTIIGDELEMGSHSRIWRGSDDVGRALPSGIYYLKLKVNDEHTVTTKAVLLK